MCLLSQFILISLLVHAYCRGDSVVFLNISFDSSSYRERDRQPFRVVGRSFVSAIINQEINQYVETSSYSTERQKLNSQCCLRLSPAVLICFWARKKMRPRCRETGAHTCFSLNRSSARGVLARSPPCASERSLWRDKRFGLCLYVQPSARPFQNSNADGISHGLSLVCYPILFGPGTEVHTAIRTNFPKGVRV